MQDTQSLPPSPPPTPPSPDHRSPDPRHTKASFDSLTAVQKAVIGWLLLLSIAKILLASHLDPFGDEVFYWQCAQRLAPAYADLPFMTSLMARLGCEILGDNPLGLRLVFLLIGVAFPFAVYRLARGLVSKSDSWLAAGLALIIPGTAHLGMIAIPDVPLLFFATLFMADFERATRRPSPSLPATQSGLAAPPHPEFPAASPTASSAALDESLKGANRRLGSWFLVGLWGGLGLATHYRFILIPVAAGCYLLFTAHGRRQWRGLGPVLAGLPMLAGVMPGIIYNLAYDFEPLSYFLAGRHDRNLDWDGFFEHFAEQMILITPLLYLALLFTLITLLRRTRKGEDRAALAAFFACIPVGVFLLASPLHATHLQTAHWPVSGYLILLPFLPGALRMLAGDRPTRLRRLFVGLVPGLGVTVILLIIVELATGFLKIDELRLPFHGWTEISDRVGNYIAKDQMLSTRRPVVVADNYKLGAELEMVWHDKADFFILDHSKNYVHGRQKQFPRWGMGEKALRAAHLGQEVLVIVEVTVIATGHKKAWMEHLDWLFEPFDFIEEVRVEAVGNPKYDRLFHIYRGRVIEAR